jgi:rhodanese-related sulfurtransferase
MHRPLYRSRAMLLLVGVALALAACSGEPIAADGAINVVQALERQQAGGVLLDVRTEAEYRNGHAVGARLVPWVGGRGRLNSEFFDQVASVARTDQEVLVICQSGNRSAHAARALQQHGYRAAVNVLGGSTAWRSSGLPWESGP